MVGSRAGNRKTHQYAGATEERVKRGISFLTKREPNWIDCIDLGKFDNDSAYNCALGQIYQAMHIDNRPGFTLARRAYDFGEANPMMRFALSDLEAVDFGMECVWDSPNPLREAVALNRRWVSAILKLKGRQ